MLSADLPKYQIIRDELMNAIRTGKYGPGSRLPTERELSEHYGVHRMTVRQATTALVRAGLVIKRRPQGNFVREQMDHAVGERHVNLICIGTESSHAEIFIEHGLAAAKQRDIQARILRIYPGSEHVAAETLAGPDPSIIVGGVISRGDELGKAVRDASSRVVLIGARMDHAGVYSIVGDDEFGLRLAIDYLQDRGHERIGLIGSIIDEDHPLMELQVQYWRQAMMACGLSRGTIQKHIVRLEPVPVGGVAMAAREAVKNYYERQRVRATAMIALSEEAAIGATSALYDLDVTVPDNVSLISYAGTCRAELCIPPMTSIDVDVDQHLQVAFKRVDEIFAGSAPLATPPLVVIPPTLIERKSVTIRR
ncbi:MAG: substrate-binding domain-containing protein [Planctomycetota bacterium]